MPALATLWIWGLLLGLWACSPAGAAELRGWPAWDSFRQSFVSADGRVIDPSTPQRHTTSEGQSYALFFALVANDRESFALLLRWTENNLASGALSARLPAWQWGRRDDQGWGVLDENSASDADLWLAYTLGEAGRLWREPRYSTLGEQLAARILREETVELPQLGRLLLPGARGFNPEPGLWRLNPSYLPLQLLTRLAGLYPESGYRQLLPAARELLLRSAPRGFAPDWSAYREGEGFRTDPLTKGAGSFNAIRVYLWAGMLPPGDPAGAALLAALDPMARYVEEKGTPPLEVLAGEGIAAGSGPVGFSAALLPFLESAGRMGAARGQRLRIELDQPLRRPDNYYEQALTLFGLGWGDGRYRFAADGGLIPWWLGQ